MKFCDIASALGVKKYPEQLDSVYENLTTRSRILDEDYLTELHLKYGALGTHEDDIKRAARDILHDDNRREFVYTVCEFLKECTIEDARAIQMPATDGTHAGNMLPIFPLLSMIPSCVAEYTKRGFTKAEVQKFVNAVPNSIDVVNERYNIYGINQRFYSWLFVYTKCMIFSYGIFNIEVGRFPGDAVVLKNRASGELAIIMREGRFHKDGHVLGSAGFTDEEGAFDADFTETEDTYTGHISANGFVNPELVTLKKSEWERYIGPKDGIVSIHIPRGAPLNDKDINESIAGGIEAACRYFPEYTPKHAFCESWLLDPTLVEILGDSSKIVNFGNRFLRFPVKSAGQELFSFVYPGCDPNNYAALTENTTLQKKAKQHYLDGKFFHAFAGVFID